MKRLFNKRCMHLLQCRYSVYFLILSLTGYLYIISVQTLGIRPSNELNVNVETTRGKRRKLNVYLQLNGINATPETNDITINRDDVKKNDKLYAEERRYNASIMSRTKEVEMSSHTSTTFLDRKARRLPKALIIGVKKCGTRALLEYLRLHPDIKAPGPEPHFFDKFYHMGLDWYRERMPLTTSSQTTIEKTPRYFVNFDAPKRIWDMSRSIKLIVVVRDPVTRAISDFTQGATKRNYLHQSVFIRKAIHANGTGDVNTHWSIINTGLYIQHLKRWLRYFSLDQMYFVSGENLISDPAKELEGLQAFLGVKPVITNRHFYFNATKGFPCVSKHSRTSSSRCFNNSKGRQHLNIDAKILVKLKTFYNPFNEEFYNLTGRKFGW